MKSLDSLKQFIANPNPNTATIFCEEYREMPLCPPNVPGHCGHCSWNEGGCIIHQMDRLILTWAVLQFNWEGRTELMVQLHLIVTEFFAHYTADPPHRNPEA